MKQQKCTTASVQQLCQNIHSEAYRGQMNRRCAELIEQMASSLHNCQCYENKNHPGKEELDAVKQIKQTG